MKTIKLLPLFLLFVFASCSSIRVYSDYDKTANFMQYKTYAYQKNGIDKAEISDLDKKRILKAIDQQMALKGFTKSDTPDLLVNIFTKEREQVDVNQFSAGWGYGWGFGWNPFFFGGNTTNVNRYTEGTLFIDLIDASKKELIWQGEGQGTLTKNPEKKDAMINEFVAKILQQYPPKIK